MATRKARRRTGRKGSNMQLQGAAPPITQSSVLTSTGVRVTTSLLSDTFTGSNGAAWNGSNWAQGYSGGGSATLQDGWGRINVTGDRHSRRSVPALPADVQISGKLRMVNETWPGIYLRAEDNMDTGRGYYFMPLWNSDSVHIARDGTPSNLYTGGLTFASEAPTIVDFYANYAVSFRFQVRTEGSSVRIKLKLWYPGNAEPDWQFNYVDSSSNRITATGRAGFSIGSPSSNRSFDVDDIVLSTPT